MIRYAGFDPDEDNFDGVGLAPLHRQDVQPRTTINIVRAGELRREGLGWAEIGRILAQDVGRRMPFTSQSVYAAVSYARRI